MKNIVDDFVEMICPVCGEYYFVDDTIAEKEEPDYEGKERDQCSECGWIYDLEQFKDPNLSNKSNKLSLNAYKKEYKKIKEKDPNYNYLQANYVPTPHMCPVCGKYEFVDHNSFDICEFCGWEDDDVQLSNPDFGGGANDLSLNQYKEKYHQLIKENPNYKRFK